jgi:hypothetical protein
MKLFKDDEKYYDLTNIETKIVNNDTDKVIEFLIDNIINTYKLNENGCIFIRENAEYKFTLDTINNQSTYLLKETDTLLDIKVEKCEYKKTAEKITIKYQLETDDNLNTIEISIQGEAYEKFFK